MTNEILRKPRVLAIIGIGNFSLYEAIKRGDFPAPIKLGRVPSAGGARMSRTGWQAVKLRSLDMSDGQMKTQVRGQTQPGQADRFATAAGIPSHRERDDS